MSAFPHSEAFWAALSGDTADGLRTRPDIEAVLAEKLQQARGAFPNIVLDWDRFCRHWGRQLAKAERPGEELERLHTPDLLLAFACAERHPAALEELRSRLIPRILPAVRQVQGANGFAEEIEQRLLERLLVAEGMQAPRIADYAGRGSLEHWLRAVALRLALNFQRDAKRSPEIAAGEGLLEVAAPVRDPQFELLQKRYGAELKVALGRAISGLDRQERNILRLYFVEELSLNQIAALYQANKSTISRRIGRARRTLLDATRRDLEQRLGVGGAELESLMKALGPYVPLSMSGLLTSEE